MTKKRMTLLQYCVDVGGQEAAARQIGVSFTTVNRWLNGHKVPTGLSRARLDDLGIGDIR